MSHALSSNYEEVSLEAMALELADHESTNLSPLDALLEVEEFLMREHGMTFMQAVRAGVDHQRG